MKKDTAKAVDETTQLVLEIFGRLQTCVGFTTQDLWQLHVNDPHIQEFAAERELFNRLSNRLRDANPTMISHTIIRERILYGIIGFALEQSLPEIEVAQTAQQVITILLTYQATRDIDVPIVNLDVESSSLAIGSVTFHSITDQDRTTQWWNDIQSYWGTGSAYFQIVSYARVKSPGDIDSSVDFAETVVDETLLLLRGIAFPITEDNIPQIGVINDFPATQDHPFRLSAPKENIHLEYPSPQVTTHVAVRPYKLQSELLSSISPTNLSSLINLVSSEGFYPNHKMAMKLLTGFRWVGEASKPDVVPARFAKLSLALETLIGGETKDEMLTSKGITAMLAERAAFLADIPDRSRRSIDSDVRQYYKIRSRIVHGERQNIAGSDLVGFADLVRAVAWSLLTRIADFSSVDKLETWVMQQRYSE